MIEYNGSKRGRPMKNEFLEAGRIVSTSGVKGEVRVEPWADSPEFLLPFETLYLGNEKMEVKVEKSRVQKHVVVMKFDFVNDMDQANALRGKILFIKRADVKLSENTYFVKDLIGLAVLDADDPTIEYGILTEVSATGANDVYHIKKNDKTYYIPAIRQVVIETQIEEGRMLIRPLEGLFEDAD